MKHLLLALAIGLTAMGCCERDPDENINPNVLPPATQVGANTGGCLVNGEVWVASTKSPSSRFDRYTIYSSKADGGFKLRIILKNIKNEEELIELALADDEPLKLNYEYVLEEETAYEDIHSMAYFGSVLMKDFYTTTSDYKGKLTITHIDRKKQFLSGTFEMEMIEVKHYYPTKEYGNKKIKITKGRFDRNFY